MAEQIDLGALQAQLELNRSSLADIIMAKLPGFGAAATPQSTKKEPPAPRNPTLGVGAKAKDNKQIDTKGKSVQDLRLKGMLTGKRKREEAASQQQQQQQDEEEEEGRSAKVSAKASAKNKKNDPFAVKGNGAAPQHNNKPGIVVVDGEEIDMSKLSKAQRKKVNKRIRAQEEEEGTAGQDATEPIASSSKATVQEAKIKPSKESTKPKKEAPKAAVVALTEDAEPSTAGLTALQAQMLSKLSGSRFRTINEKLYTTESTEALRMVQDNPTIFDEYHKGFREQVKGWPKNPVDKIAELLDPEAKHRTSKVTKTRMARYTPGAMVVDLGAGEAGLARKLVGKGVKVLSFDLVDTADGWVRGLDAAKIGGLPLPGYYDPADPCGRKAPTQTKKEKKAMVGNAPGVADVAVFCLSLMGTNWIQMILEAKRVLRVGGEILIAEVSSRFNDFDQFIQIVQKLGFALESSDTSNTHFVLFEFVKLAPGQQAAEEEEEDDEVTEQELVEQGKAILKPCLYKRR